MTRPAGPAQSVFGALAVLLLVTLCAGIPGAYLMRSAVASYGVLESGGQSQLAHCEDQAFSDCDRAYMGRG